MRIGLVVDAVRQAWNVHELAKWARERQDLEIAFLLIVAGRCQRAGAPDRQSGQRRGVSSADCVRATTFRFLCRIEESLLRLVAKSVVPPCLEDLAGFPPDRIIDLVATNGRSADPHDTGADELHEGCFGEEVMARIASLRLDLFVGLVSGLPYRELASTARFGAVSLEHEGEAVGTAGMGAFWTTFHRCESSGFTIRAYGSDGGEGEVLTRGCVRNGLSYLWNRSVLYRKSLHYLKEYLARIASSRRWQTILSCAPRPDVATRLPGVFEQVSYFARMLSVAGAGVVQEQLLRKAQRFSVYYAPSGWHQLDMRQARRIENPANAFLADPFLLAHDGREYCFVEDYCFHDLRGRISAYELSDTGARRIGEVIREPFHLSFPFVFRYESRIYMIPESSANRDVRLYECVRVPDRWELRKILMKDVSMVDTMVFERHGRWWMLGNLDPADSGDFCAELHVFHADDPLSDRWIPHARNPVLIDSRNARNGGILFDGDVVYRVAQRQAFGTYGSGISVRRIDVLTSEDYAESEWHAEEPRGLDGSAHVHHLHSSPRFSVFDRWAIERVTTGATVSRN